MYKLDEKRAVITGAGSGLGRAIATELGREGWKIGIADVNDSGAEETLELVKKAGGTGETFHSDVSEHSTVQSMAEYFFDSWGGVDLLVNCAGVVATGFVGDISLDDWRWVHGIDFWGEVYNCHEFIPRMKAQGGGHILNIASAAGLITFPFSAPYCTAKAAVISLSEVLRIELAPYNIGITVACPMFFKSNLMKTMRIDDGEMKDVAELGFDRISTGADEVARRIIKSVKKNRLYAIPQISGIVPWVVLRLSPRFFYGAFRFIAGRSFAIPLVKKLGGRAFK